MSFGSSRNILCLYAFWLKLSYFVYVRHLPRKLTLDFYFGRTGFEAAGTPTILSEGFLAFRSPFSGSDHSFYSDFYAFVIIIQHHSHKSLTKSLNELQTSLILRFFILFIAPSSELAVF